jgi:hypothetical protein
MAPLAGVADLMRQAPRWPGSFSRLLADLAKPLAEADPELRRAVFEAFRLRIEIDRNSGLVRLKALVSRAFSQVKDLSERLLH